MRAASCWLLVLADGQLAAVLVRLDGEHHTIDVGKWFLEAGFGKCAVNSANSPLWSTPEEAGSGFGRGWHC